MNKGFRILALGLLFLLAACGPADTPRDVTEKFEELKKNLDEDRLGASIASLEQFAEEYKKMSVAAWAQMEIKALREKAKSQYENACGLARDGDFERAEKILLDLSTHFTQEEEGRLAKEYLRFDFGFFKASRLMSEGEADEAEKILVSLRSDRNSAEEKQKIERMLDSVSQVRAAREKSDEARMQATCQHLRVRIVSSYAARGQYPESITLDSPFLHDPTGEEKFTAEIASVENYETSKGDFSLIASAKRSSVRCRISKDVVEIIKAK